MTLWGMMASQHSEQALAPCHGSLRDVTRKILPAAFIVLFIITGTVVLVYSLSLHEPVPSTFASGAAISFGILIALILIGNFLLYAHMRMSLIRSASGSERSTRIDGEREAWYVRLRKFFDECEDWPRRLIREFALRKEIGRERRKRSFATARHNHHRNPNLNPDGRPPVDRVDGFAELELGELSGDQIAPRDMCDAGRCSNGGSRTRNAQHRSSSARSYTGNNSEVEELQHEMGGSSRGSQICARGTDECLRDAEQGPSRGPMEPAEAVNASTARHLTKRSEDESTGHLQLPRNRLQPGASPVPVRYGDKIEIRDISEHSAECYCLESPLEIKRPFDIRVLTPDSPQQYSTRPTLGARAISDQKLNNYPSSVDLVQQSLKSGEVASYLEFVHINKEGHETQTSKLSRNINSIEAPGHTWSPNTTNCHNRVTQEACMRIRDDCNSFASSGITSCQEFSVTSIPSFKMAPKLPQLERGSGASGFTSQFMESLSSTLDTDDERSSKRSASVKPPYKSAGVKGYISQEAPH